MAKIEQRLVVEYGIDLDGVWLPLGMLRRLDEHGPWSPPFTEATADQAEVLVAHGLAQRHNDGLCRGGGLRNFVDAFPFEQTMPFSKLPPDGNGAPPAENSQRGTRPTD
jgi:hypothetical protein